MKRYLFIVLATSLSLAACSKKDDVAAAPAAAASQPAAQAANSGKLVQIQQAGMYTYGEVELANGQKVWIAGGHIEAKPGDTVQWGQYSVMQNFNAKSLGRVFEQILFVNDWGPLGGSTAQIAPHGMPPGQAPAQPDTAAPVAGAAVGEVKSAQTAAGYTYLEVQQGAKTVWLAVPETQVKAGDKVSWSDGMPMSNFNAKSINRTFDSIIFASGVTKAP